MTQTQTVPQVIVILLLTLAAACARAGGSEGSQTEACIRAGAAFLWARQADDGGWHSTRYGLLRSGQSLTPFVLNTLLLIPHADGQGNSLKCARALAFIEAHVSPGGGLGLADELLRDYPTYATAQGLQAVAKLGGRDDLATKLAAFLKREQFTGDPWTMEHAAYGAWGMGGVERTPREPGQVDISMTRHALEALRAGSPEKHGQAFADAQVFLLRCQNFSSADAPANPDDADDGGFFFSTVVAQANKAGARGKSFYSYGTATADGILALLACGLPAEDARAQAALKWLQRHVSVDGVPRLPEKREKSWNTGLLYYYYAAVARVYRKLVPASTPEGAAFRAALSARLLKAQRPDGSWANENFLVKEDDALIATTLALNALIDLQ